MPSASMARHLHHLLFSCCSSSSSESTNTTTHKPHDPPSSPSRSSTSSDLSAAVTAHRLTPSGPGVSDSFLDSARAVGVGAVAVAVARYSQEPAEEFRRSMAAMAAAMGLVDPQAQHECLHELLLCYLALNGKHAHQYIVRAFADILDGLTAASVTAAKEG